jgi:hypothetical protein
MNIGTLPQDFVLGLSDLRKEIARLPSRDAEGPLSMKNTLKGMVELFRNLDQRLKRLESKAQ